MPKQKYYTEIFVSTKLFFFGLNQRHFQVFQMFGFLKKQEGSNWRNTKNLIKNFKSFFSRFD